MHRMLVSERATIAADKKMHAHATKVAKSDQLYGIVKAIAVNVYGPLGR